MDSKEQPAKPADTELPELPEELRRANENIRKAQGDDATASVDTKRTGNKPEIDRGR